MCDFVACFFRLLNLVLVLFVVLVWLVFFLVYFVFFIVPPRVPVRPSVGPSARFGSLIHNARNRKERRASLSTVAAAAASEHTTAFAPLRPAARLSLCLSVCVCWCDELCAF